MKSEKNKSQLSLYLIIGVVLGFGYGVAFVNNWLVLNKKFPKLKMFKIPLQAEVWGTASDWAMVLVTTISAVYLIKTFKAQQSLRRMELMPQFKLKFKDDKYYLKLGKNTALNVYGFREGFDEPRKEIPIWHKYHHPVYVYRQPTDNVGENVNLYGKIEFEDGEGNKYVQEVYHTESVLIIFPTKKRES